MLYFPKFVVFLFGLSIGSFLNVVICRVPKKESILSPPSHCPQCGHKLKIWENIPLLSYILLRGRCRQCKTHISIQYPVIELLNAVLFLWIFDIYGFSFQAVIYSAFTSVLLALSVIDLHTKLLPDIITLPSITAACVMSLMSLVPALKDIIPFNPRMSFLGMLAAAGPLLLISFVYYKLTGREGLGGGDIKLMLLVGVLLGPQKSFITLFLAALSGTIIGIPLTLFKGGSRQTEIPFGPYLSAAAWIAMIWGGEIVEGYFRFIGLSN